MKTGIEADILKEVQALADKTFETRNRIIEATWRAIVKDDEIKPEDGVLQIQEGIRTKEGKKETRYTFMYKENVAATIIEKQEYCHYSYFLISDTIRESDIVEKMIEVEAMQQEKENRRKQNTSGSMDYMWANKSAFQQTTMAGLGSIGICRSECVQNGKACPIYETCAQKNMIRNIL